MEIMSISNRFYEGQVVGVETTHAVPHTIVYCMEAPSAFQWHILTPDEANGAQNGDRVRIGYVSTPSWGRWQVIEVFTPRPPAPERFRMTFDVEVAASIRDSLKEYEERRNYARDAVISAGMPAIDNRMYPGVRVLNVQMED